MLLCKSKSVSFKKGGLWREGDANVFVLVSKMGGGGERGIHDSAILCIYTKAHTNQRTRVY